jgi:2-keto-3-deoxy-galactonokinase
MSGELDVHEAEEAHEGIKHEANIIAVDIGTTSLRSHVYDNHGHIKASSSKKVWFILKCHKAEPTF